MVSLAEEEEKEEVAKDQTRVRIRVCHSKRVNKLEKVLDC